MVSPIRAMREKMKSERNHSRESTCVIKPITDKHNIDLLLLELECDKKALKQFNSIADKVSYKRNVLVPKYRPMVEEYLASGAKYPNPIFSTIFSTTTIWLFDIGELDTFIQWCLFAINNEIPTPDFVKRNWQTFCADSIFKWSESQSEKGASIEPYFADMFFLIDSGQWRLLEKISAKYYKLAGQQLLRDEHGVIRVSHIGYVEKLEKSLEWLEKANELYPQIGVGDLIKNRIPARIKALTTGTNL